VVRERWKNVISKSETKCQNLQNQYESQAEQEKGEQDLEKLTMGVRYQLLQAGRQQRSILQYDSSEDDVQACQSSKSGLIVVILLFLGFVMYLPFFPFSSNRPIVLVWPANQSRNASVLSRPNENTTLLAPSSVCNPNPVNSNATAIDNDDLVLLVVVCSAMSNFQERQTIRDSWASDVDSLAQTKVIFLLGTIGNLTNDLQTNVTRESDIHDDILQVDFIDSYANLTVKSLMLLKWFSNSCEKVPYVLKTDDDVYINLKNLHALVNKNKKTNLLVGTLICGATPIRDPYNKWFSPKYMYGKKRYPNYLSGTAYLMSRSITAKLYEAALKTPVFHMEDIFITGILAQSVGIRPEDNVGFSYVKRKATPCLYVQIISSHHLAMDEMKDMHGKVMQKQGKCTPIKKKFLRTYGPGRCLWTPPK